MVVNTTNTFAKTICSICYEDLKPIVEDLQAISICGHVFHELCLQQWFEYSSSAKKCSCPVCKQSCSATTASRLYFQSIGEQTEPPPIESQNEADYAEKLTRFEKKNSALSSLVDRQVKDLEKLQQELHVSKDLLKKEVILKEDAEHEKASIQRLLLAKSQELDMVKLQCSKIEERSIALAKELAAVKLVSDLNLDEDEVLKLASFGNDANSKDTVDVLRKSLVIRNKSYKELMAKCNQLGRGKAHSCKKLEKAKEKIDKLKIRVQELEMVVEVKDNEALRALKAAKKINSKEGILDCSNGNSNASSANHLSSKYQKERNFMSVDYMEQRGSFTNDKENFNFIDDMATMCTEVPNKRTKVDFVKDETSSKVTAAVHVLSDINSINPFIKHLKSSPAKSETVSYAIREAKVHGVASSDRDFGLKTCINGDKGGTLAATVNEEVHLLVDDIKQLPPMLNIKKDSLSPTTFSKPGDVCFSGGLLGPDGANRYLGKWCKRGQNKGLVAMQSTSTSSGDLIAVGSDGRGGTIKVLRSLKESSLDDKENSEPTKRCKYGAKTSNLQSRGCLQIEHFFGRASD